LITICGYRLFVRYSTISLNLLWVFLLGLVPAHAFTLVPTVETLTIPNVGAGFQTISFENSYTNPVPACTYQLPSTGDPPATVRIDGLGPSGMQVRIQQFENSIVVTPGLVQCLVVEAGTTILPDGTRIQARAVLSTETHGLNTANGYATGSIPTMDNVSSLFSGFTNPTVLGQVITFNDMNASVFHANNCDRINDPPYNTGFADGMCVTKAIGEINGTRSPETLGIIVIEEGSGSFNDVAFIAQTSAKFVNGVGNPPPETLNLGSDFEFGVATMLGGNGNQGGWAVFVGPNGGTGSTLSVAIDEEVVAGDTSRTHISENVGYFAARRVPLFTASKAVDRTSIAEPLTLNYEIVLENTSRISQTGVDLTDTLPDGSAGTLAGPVESGGSNAGVFEPGETWTYTISYPVSAGEISTGTDLINSVEVSTDQYASFGIADESASATTVIEPANPSLAVTKTADLTVNVAAGETVTYTYEVTNTGNQSLANISLIDTHNGTGAAPVPGGETLTNDVGVNGDSTDTTPGDGTWDTLAPGDQVTFTATYTVTQQDIDTLQ